MLEENVNVYVYNVLKKDICRIHGKVLRLLDFCCKSKATVLFFGIAILVFAIFWYIIFKLLFFDSILVQDTILQLVYSH